MKDFFARVLSATAGVFLALSIIVLMVVIISVIGMFSTPRISEKSVLYIDLQGIISERSNETAFSYFGFDDVSPSLETMLGAISEAKTNDKIAGIYICAGALSATPASLQELRHAIVDFRKSGKFVVSYGGTYTQGAYYVCSAASRIFLNPAGEVEWRGLSSENIYYKDLLDKIGIKMQVVKVGSYKSATEPFTATEMSPESKEQVTQYVAGIWNNIKKDVAASRKLDEQVLDSLANEYLALQSSKSLLAVGFIDTIAYKDDADEYVARLVNEEEPDNVSYADMNMLAELAQEQDDGEEIAVYYAYGEIVSTEEQGSLYDNMINASDVIEDLRTLAKDENVKAVVLRINSGGGSAYASEQIWHAIRDLSHKKPVVVSMGGMAASGAYYMSADADYVFAEPTTLTGSIGIFGMIPDMSGLLKEKLGLKFDGIKTNEHSDFFTQSRPLDENETEMLQSYVDRGYDLFIKRVSEGRKLSDKRVREIAQGRVYTGEDALQLHLVDKLGTLSDAVDYAASQAKIKTYHTVHYPLQQSWFQQLIDSRTTEYADMQLREYLGDFHSIFSLIKNIDKYDRIQARIPYNPIIK